MGLLNSPEYYDVIIRTQYLLRPFGFLAVSLMITAMESVKSENRTMLTNISFLFSGALIVGIFSPSSIVITWTAIGWITTYSMEFEFGRLVLFATVIFSAVPLGIRLYRRLANFLQKDKVISFLFWFTVAFTSTILILQPLQQLVPDVLIWLFQPSTFILDITLFVLLVTFLFQKHPTILFVETHETSELYIIKQESGLPLYHFEFRGGRSGGSEIISAFFTGIKHFVKYSLGKGEIESIQVGDQEMIIKEGIYTYGILIAKQSSELTRNLLRISVDSFEKIYQFNNVDYIELKRMKAFDSIIERYFEFAIIR